MGIEPENLPTAAKNSRSAIPGLGRLLIRSLTLDKGRTLLCVLAIAAALTVVIALEGFKSGLFHQVRAYREQLPATYVAVPAGVASVAYARAGVTPEIQEAVARAPGVADARAIVSAPVIFTRGEDRSPITLVGYESVGGPWELTQGRHVAARGEAVLDAALARQFSLDVGHDVDLIGKTYRIVGLSRDTSSMLGSYVFIGLQDAHAALHGSRPSDPPGGTASFLLVTVEGGRDESQVRDSIAAAVPQVRLVTPKELADSDVALIEGIMGSTVNALVIASYVVGLLVLALTLYATVLDQEREFGIVKAIGASNPALYRYVVGQVTVLAAVGFLLAVLASMGVAWLVSQAVPQYLVLPLEGSVLLRAAVATVVLGLLAAVVPARQVGNVEPAVAFRGGGS